MPPKTRITKADIINTAVDIVRKNGETALNARNIAAALNCSTQPVFSNFATMDDLRLAVVEAADALCGEYMKREVESGEYPHTRQTAWLISVLQKKKRNCSNYCI